MVEAREAQPQKRTYSSLIAELGRAQKPGHGVSPYLRYINRPLGRRFAAIAHILRLTPNAVTWISLLFTAAGLVILTTVGPSITSTVLVPLLLAIGFGLDSADGQLARLRKSGGPAGEWFDHVVDAGRAPAVQLAVLIYLMRWDDRIWMMAIPMVFLIVGSTRFFGQILAEQLRARHGVPNAAQPNDTATNRRAWMQLPSDTGVINLSFALVAWPFSFAVAYAILCGWSGMLAIASFRRRYRELSTVGSSGDS